MNLQYTKKFFWTTTTLIMVGMSLIVVSILFIQKPALRCAMQYDFINANVVCNDKASISKAGYAKTQDEILQYINGQKQQGNADSVSVYFRDLEDGPIFGIEETAPFVPASLLKLPLSLVFFRIAEESPSILEEKIVFQGSKIAFDQFYKPARTLVPNTVYTVEELIERTLVDSDNDAYLLLYEHLENTNRFNLIKQTFLELGILSPNDQYDEIISVRRYASIFRALYNASFVKPEYSEKLLNWMSGTDFVYGLDSKLHGDAKISHKFGERSLENGVKQLHDCGIIYYPNNPYLLCVMTKGSDYEKLHSVISSISEIVYKEVNGRKIQ